MLIKLLNHINLQYSKYERKSKELLLQHIIEHVDSVIDLWTNNNTQY